MTEEEELKKFHRTTYYQTILYRKLQDTIIDKQYRVTRACLHLGERWSMVKQYLSTEQKKDLDALTQKYGRNGGKRLRRVATRIATHQEIIK